MRIPTSLKALAVLFALAALAPAAHAQVGRITGVVTDAANGQPLEGVQILLRGTGYGALTRSNGRFLIISVPPGTYTVVARRLGFQEQQVQNVIALIDVTREVNFRLSTSSSTLASVRVTEAETPLIQPGITGTSDAITAVELQSLPVTDIRGALSLQPGFLASPENSDVVSYTDVRRALQPTRIRGGRPTESITFIDGIPVNNFLFGGAAVDITRDAVEQIDFVRGGFEPQYGNALSGIVNIAVKEGTRDLRGSIEARSSAVGGRFGSNYDDARDFRQFQGFVSGSVPATANRLRFLVAGRQTSGANRTLEFDDQVYNPRANVTDFKANFQSVYDLFPGFRAIGFSHSRDIIAKTSFYFTPVSKVSVTMLDYERQSQPYVFDWVQTGFDGYAQCVKLYPDLEGTCSTVYNNGRTVRTINDLQDTNNENWYVRQASTRQTRQLYVGSVSHTLGRANISASVGQFNQRRLTCTYASAICQGTRLAYTYFQGPFVYTGGRSRNSGVPLFGTEELGGGDEIRTLVFRTDASWQITDHHNLQAGIFRQGHDVQFKEWRDVGLNRSTLDFSEFNAYPWDAAVYLQDRIEYDFLTLKLGARFDYGKAPGRFFADPRDPTNGTTAREVCNNPTQYGLPANSFEGTDPNGVPLTGLAACSVRDSLMKFATGIAAGDDFREAPTRTQFSPRIGVQFPLTATSSFFFNFGKFAQNPSMYDLYRGTGIGLPTEATPAGVKIVQQAGSIPLLGNPQLKTELATSYELGYAIEFLRNYALRVVAFNKDQSNLSGIGTGGYRPDGVTRVSDPGATYGVSQPAYRVLVNRDYQTARGLEMTLRRRLSNYWAFDMNYAWSRVTQNADPPEQEAEKQSQGAPAVAQIRSSVDQPHVFNGTLRLQTRSKAPPVRWVGKYLAHSTLTTTLRASSGLPYTPQLDFAGSVREDRNSGTSPSNITVDLYAARDWAIGNIRLGGFMYMNNALNRKNCVVVFSTTGQCQSGGFAVGKLEKNRLGAGLSQSGTFSQAYDRPDYVSEPRSVSGGLRLTF